MVSSWACAAAWPQEAILTTVERDKGGNKEMNIEKT